MTLAFAPERIEQWPPARRILRSVSVWHSERGAQTLRYYGTHPNLKGPPAMGIIWIIGIGFGAGIIAKFVMPGFNHSSGFNLTITLGVLGAVAASFLGLMLGWFAPGHGAGMLSAAIGAVAALAGWDHAQKRA